MISRLQPPYACAHAFDNAGAFMAQHDGQRHWYAQPVVAGKIGMADAARDDADSGLIGLRIIEFHRFDLRRREFGARYGGMNFHTESFVVLVLKSTISMRWNRAGRGPLGAKRAALSPRNSTASRGCSLCSIP